MQHFRELFPTQAVTRGKAPVHILERQPRGIMQVRFKQHDGQKITIETALKRLEVDAFVVLHGGKIVNETYFRGMERSTPHFLLSVHKSIVSTVIGTLIGDGLLAYDKTVDTYVPELKNSAHAGTTVRQALDMLSAVEYSYVSNNSQKPTFAAHKESVHPAAPYLNVPVGSQEFVLQLSKRDCDEHGECMHYKDLLQAEPFVGAYLSDGIGYRSFFYVDSHRKRAIAALGGYGQLCYFSPADETVIIILSSPPPTEARVAKGIAPKVVARTEKGEELDRWNLCRKLCAHLANQQ